MCEQNTNPHLRLHLQVQHYLRRLCDQMLRRRQQKLQIHQLTQPLLASSTSRLR